MEENCATPACAIILTHLDCADAKLNAIQLDMAKSSALIRRCETFQQHTMNGKVTVVSINGENAGGYIVQKRERHFQD